MRRFSRFSFAILTSACGASPPPPRAATAATRPRRPRPRLRRPRPTLRPPQRQRRRHRRRYPRGVDRRRTAFPRPAVVAARRRRSLYPLDDTPSSRRPPGTDVLEMDLQMTADGVVVVHHDATVDRRTETTGRAVLEAPGTRQGLPVPRPRQERIFHDQYPFRHAHGRCRRRRLHHRLQDRDLPNPCRGVPDHVLDLEISAARR